MTTYIFIVGLGELLSSSLAGCEEIITFPHETQSVIIMVWCEMLFSDIYIAQYILNVCAKVKLSWFGSVTYNWAIDSLYETAITTSYTSTSST
jgi:hypothetical protein